MALNIISPRVDALAREVAAMPEAEVALEVLLARIDLERGPDMDPRPLKEIREEIWGGL